MGAITMSDDQHIGAMAKLLFFTQQGKLIWTPIKPEKVKAIPENEVISSFFSCTYKNQSLRIYKKKYKTIRKIYPSNFSALSAAVAGAFYDYKTEVVWDADIVLEITDNFGNSIWQFPEENILDDLLEAVKFKASGAQELIQLLLTDDSETNSNT
jgi:hypothetical protein